MTCAHLRDWDQCVVLQLNDSCCLQLWQWFLLLYTVGQKLWDQKLIILSNRNRLSSFFFTGRFLGKFGVNSLLTIPLLLVWFFSVNLEWVVINVYLATLPCRTNVTKQAISDKLQGSIYGVVRLLITKLLLRLKAVNIWQSWKQERGFLLHSVCLA